MSPTSGKGWTTHRSERCSVRYVEICLCKFASDWFRFQFGTILDVRWPSKRIKSTRRFCYVQYTSPVCSDVVIWPETH